MDDKDYRWLRAEMELNGLKDDICDMMAAGALERAWIMGWKDG